MQEVDRKDFVSFNLYSSNNTGNRVILEKYLWCYNGAFFDLTIEKYSSALLKVIDEVITNAVDACLKITNGEIRLAFKNNFIEVINYGKYIKFEDIQDCFCREYTGSNYDIESDSVAGGLNGVGAKLTNILSREMYVEVSNGQEIYKQCFTNNSRERTVPIIENRAENKYVKVSFELLFDEICRISKLLPSINWIDKNRQLVDKIIERRAFEAAIYSNASIYYNDKMIKCDFRQFVVMHKRVSEDKIIMHKFDEKWPFQVGIIFHEPVQTEKKLEPYGELFVTMINGVMLEEPPNYVNKFILKIENYIKEHPELQQFLHASVESQKKLNAIYFRKHITIITMGSCPKKHFDFKGQDKSTVNFDRESLNYIDKNYNFPITFLSQAWTCVSNILRRLIKPKNTNNKKAHVKYYVPALRTNAKYLCVVEGLSAALLFKQLIEQCKELNHNECGIYSIGGVPMNAVKNSKFLPLGVLQTERLKLNDGLQALVNCMGLDYQNPAKWGRYRHIIIGTDQDSDGIGKICSLIMCFFLLYFPELVRAGLLMRYRTPIIRANHGQEVLDFYSEQEFEQQKLMLPNLKGDYFKGLACHGETEIRKMSRNFFKDLIQIKYDESCEQLMHTLYGQHTAMRKQALLEFDENAIRTYKQDLEITITEHFNNESLTEQNSNIRRMLPDLTDGMTPCQRKVICTLRLKPKKNYEKITVSAMGGRVKDKMNYNHGEASLEGTIKRLAQVFPGAHNFPMLLPVSASNGSQDSGRDVASAARYTNVCLNPFISIYFPQVDDSLLELREEEGKIFEPLYYVPVVPRVLLETTKALATGWNCNLVCRDFKQVMKYVKYSIENNSPVCSDLLARVELAPRMKIIVDNDKEYCIGNYTFKSGESSDLIIIDQLPLGLWGEKFVKNIKVEKSKVKEKDKKKKKKSDKQEENKQKQYDLYVESIHNLSGNRINIIIQIKKGSLEQIKSYCTKPFLDPIIEYFGIYKIYTRNLNFYCQDRLAQFTGLPQIFEKWFCKRRELYIMRIEKTRVLYNAQLHLYENIYHFIINTSKSFTNIKEQQQLIILETTPIEYTDGTKFEKYMAINESKIKMSQPGTAEHMQVAIYNNASYNYILNLNYKKSNIERAQFYKDKIDEIRKKLTNEQEFCWQTIWMGEVKKIEVLYNYGRSINWEWKQIIQFAKQRGII